MKEKFYYKLWFIILMFIIFFPVAYFLLWKSKGISLKTKKIVTGVSVAAIALIVIFAPDPIVVESSYDIKESEITYTTEDIPAKDAVYEDTETYTTAMSGEYVIGTAPKDLVTGDETSFTTAQSGTYIAGEDFPAGVYDIEVISGNGNVMGTGLNEIMGSGTGYAGIDDMYVSTYDNKTFSAGDELEVSGVSVELVPQDEDDMVILPGTYTLVATNGGGNVIGTGINEIMGTSDKNDVIDMYVPQYDNKEFKDGDTLTVTGVSLDLQPKEDKILVKEATEAIPGHEQTETLQSSKVGEVCSVDGTETDCSEVAKYDDLKSSLETTSTVTESIEYQYEEYTCKIDGSEKNCDKLTDYENLKAELDSLI